MSEIALSKRFWGGGVDHLAVSAKAAALKKAGWMWWGLGRGSRTLIRLRLSRMRLRRRSTRDD